MIHPGADPSVSLHGRHTDAGVKLEGARFTEADLSAAFREGWKARDRNPGLKRIVKRDMMWALSGSRHAEHRYEKDHRRYHHSKWLTSDIRRELLSAVAACPLTSAEGVASGQLREES